MTYWTPLVVLVSSASKLAAGSPAVGEGVSTENVRSVDLCEVPQAPYARRWLALGVLALVQFMLSIDSTVVNVALPSIQGDLGFQPAGLAWVMNAYSLTAGGFLLLGGRVSDLADRKRLFMIGVVLFAGASLVSGVASNPGTLVVARFAQGLGVAVVSPAALALAVLMFPDARERARAIGMWGGLAGLGGTFGVVIGGVVTSAISWRWIFLINLPIAVVVLTASVRLVPRSPVERRARIEPWGAVLGTAAMTTLVYGLLNASSHAWGGAAVLVPVVAGVVLLGAFIASQALVRDPLLPLGFFRDRTRSAANVAAILGMASFMTMFFVLTLYLQDFGHYSALRSGLAYLPFGLAMLVGIYVSTNLLPRIGIKFGVAGAFLIGAAAMLSLGQIGGSLHYAQLVLPATLCYGFAQGVIFPALRYAALHGATPSEVGLAGGVQNTTLQLGGSLGLAVLVTVALRHAGALAAGGANPQEATVDGYVLAFRIGAGVMLAAALLVLFFFEHVAAAARPGALGATRKETP
ncbi:MFS transporter [Amycolatopsis sp. NPDC051372]|uniref:MFS transporter n=1 Tax=unclassified Amycolatopsis TaxID=2618356 RepID=UPI0034306E9E